MLSDGGLQPERTALAWRRTVCSLLIFELVAARVAGELDRPLLAVVFITATVPTLTLMRGSRSRSAPAAHGLAEDAAGVVYSTSPVGRRGLLLSVLVATFGVLCLPALASGAIDGHGIGESFREIG
ncbi:DUF202 domain-containing protein [Nocardia rhamnosiphila]